MRKYYLDNVRWMTVVIVVFYHVLYMYNAEGILGGAGRITNLSVQPYDAFMYFVYPWFMPVLFITAGISSKLYLDRHGAGGKMHGVRVANYEAATFDALFEHIGNGIAATSSYAQDFYCLVGYHPIGGCDHIIIFSHNARR